MKYKDVLSNMLVGVGIGLIFGVACHSYAYGLLIGLFYFASSFLVIKYKECNKPKKTTKK